MAAKKRRSKKARPPIEAGNGDPDIIPPELLGVILEKIGTRVVFTAILAWPALARLAALEPYRSMLLRNRASSLRPRQMLKLENATLKKMVRSFGVTPLRDRSGGLDLAMRPLLQSQLMLVARLTCSDPQCYGCARLRSPPRWSQAWSDAAALLPTFVSKHGEVHTDVMRQFVRGVEELRDLSGYPWASHGSDARDDAIDLLLHLGYLDERHDSGREKSRGAAPYSVPIEAKR